MEVSGRPKQVIPGTAVRRKRFTVRIDDLYGTNSNNTIVGNASGNMPVFEEGAVIEGVVTDVRNDKATVLFNGNKETVASFNCKMELRNAETGQVRRFEVVSADPKKPVLRDVTFAGYDGAVQKMSFMDIDPALPQMIEDFSEVMGDEPGDEGENIGNMSEEDYSALKYEGMTLEKFASERLSRALERIKAERAVTAENIETAVENTAEKREEIEDMAEGTRAVTYYEKIYARLLKEADLPVTEESLEALKSAEKLAESASRLNAGSMLYMIGRGLEATPENIYRAVYSGNVKNEPIDEKDWQQLLPDVGAVVASANEETGNDRVKASDARLLLEHGIPLTKENLLYKVKLENLQKEADNGDAFKMMYARAAVKAVKDGKGPAAALLAQDAPEEDGALQAAKRTVAAVAKISDDAVKLVFRERTELTIQRAVSIESLSKAQDKLDKSPEIAASIAPGMTGQEITAKLRLEEIRLRLTVEAGQRMYAKGINVASEDIEKVVTELREMQREYFRNLSQETDDGNFRSGKTAGRVLEGDAARLIGDDGIASETEERVRNLGRAPVSLIAKSFEERRTITFAQLTDRALSMRRELLESGETYESIEGRLENGGNAIGENVLKAYDEGATQIRRDLGDSIAKAFEGMDSLLEMNGIEITEANRRAVRILGYNSMEITAENIENIKYFDNKVTGLAKKMTPPVVMELLKRGVNPLDSTVDGLTQTVDRILSEMGDTPEEKYSSFLVKLEEKGAISPAERSGYIGIYRMLYRLEKSDGSPIGALLNSGRELTLGNLLTELRSAQTGIDADINDDTVIKESHYVNSISDQIRDGVNAAKTLVRDITEHTEPLAWKNALLGTGTEGHGLSGTEAESLTLEGLADRFADAAEDVSHDAELLRNVMSANTTTKELLKSFGIPDSFRNIRAAAAEFGITVEGDEPHEGDAEAITPAMRPTVTKTELVSALENELATDELLGIKTRIANAKTRQAFETSITARSAVSLTEQLDRLGLIQKLAGSGHYRFTVDNEGEPAGINLTVISNTGSSGTVSVQLRTADYNLTADFSAVITDSTRLSGKIYCDSAGALAGLQGRLEAFVEELSGLGIANGGIGLAQGSESGTGYMKRLTAAGQRAENAPHADTDTLFRVAKSFVASFM